MEATFHKHTLQFKKASGTSRGILSSKDTWFIVLSDGNNVGIGECGMFKGLSIDDRPDFESTLLWACKNVRLGLEVLLAKLTEFPSIQFGLEQAYKDLRSTKPFELFPSDFTQGKASIPINGLIWMGTKAFMKEQILTKIEAGFHCIKLKIGAIDFETELDLLKSIRKEFSAETIELRVDANGAFSPNDALEKLKRLAECHLHSIEQPIKQGQFKAMASLCEQSPLPVALDEELIGIFSVTKQAEMLQMIRPHYIILKPSLIGGYNGSAQWINLAEENNVNWWVTSALESNIGLNAISQWTYTLKNEMPQGLGTGSLFTNNFDSPLIVKNGTLRYENNRDWKVSLPNMNIK